GRSSPEQARQLFVRNRFRIIANIDTKPAPIESDPQLSGEPLDLSMSVLRSYSPVHVQYMKNMGVAASLSIAIARQGRLWGLISCHHYSPKLIPYSLRSVAELLSQMFSMTLDRLLVERSEALRVRSQGMHEMLMRRMAEGVSFLDDFGTLANALRKVIDYDGISALIRDEYRSEGDSPSAEQFLALLPGLSASSEGRVITASSLAGHIPEASAFADTAAGALILPISRPPRDYLVLWRKPLTQTVHWAGKPDMKTAPGKNRLEPRSSFAAWAETVEGHSEEWSESDLTIAESLRTTLIEVILRLTDEVASERKRAREQQDLLIAELNHRVRNILNLIRSLVSQSTKDAVNIAEFTANIDGRIKALATAHDNITRQNWSPAPLASLFESEMEAYLNDKKGRLRIVGEPILIQPEAYTVLALVVHELVTNSAKYGSLCDSKGTIDVNVGRAANGDLLVSWAERGGPPVQPPTRKGFGSTIISRIIPHDLRGKAELNFKLSGLEAEFRVPARYITAPSQIETSQSDTAPEKAIDDEAANDRAIPEHVLLVEDNMIIALDTEDGLLEAGVKSVSVQSTVTGALAAIEEREPEFAIVDFNLGTESSAKVTEELARRGVRFFLATGYSELGRDLTDLGAEGLIRKPYGLGDIEQAILGKAA
ncbi:MAG: HWE histidine kinase domain-containing protein, partial [Pseudomonadota bacterium]